MASPSQSGFFVEEVARRIRAGRNVKGSEPASPCDGCPLNDGRPKVSSFGNPDTAKIAFIGEKPGRAEVEQGRPFVGETGQLARMALREETSLDPERDVYWGNIIRCLAKPDELTETQEKQVAKRCGAYIAGELSGIRTEVPVVGAGNVPLGYFFREGGITGERAVVRLLPDGRRYFPVLHPAYLLKVEGAERVARERTFRADLRRLDRWLGRRTAWTAWTAPASHHFVTTEKGLREAEKRLLAATDLFFDFETPGLHPWVFPRGEPKIIAGGFSSVPGEAWGIALAHPEAPLPLDLTWPAVKRIMAGPSRKGALKGQHDLHWAGWFWLEVANFHGDAMLAATLLADKPYTEIKSNLLRLAADWLWEVEYPWLHVDKARIIEYPVETVVGIAMTDADLEFRIHRELMKALASR